MSKKDFTKQNKSQPKSEADRSLKVSTQDQADIDDCGSPTIYSEQNFPPVENIREFYPQPESKPVFKHVTYAPVQHQDYQNHYFMRAPPINNQPHEINQNFGLGFPVPHYQDNQQYYQYDPRQQMQYNPNYPSPTKPISRPQNMDAHEQFRYQSIDNSKIHYMHLEQPHLVIPASNLKIPQYQEKSAQMADHRKQNLAVPHQQIYYMKGNHETKSVNQLTEMQDPSVDSTFRVCEDNINNLLEEDEEISNFSSQNKHNIKILDVDIESSLKLQAQKRGANSLDRNNTHISGLLGNNKAVPAEYNNREISFYPEQHHYPAMYPYYGNHQFQQPQYINFPGPMQFNMQDMHPNSDYYKEIMLQNRKLQQEKQELMLQLQKKQIQLSNNDRNKITGSTSDFKQIQKPKFSSDQDLVDDYYQEDDILLSQKPGSKQSRLGQWKQDSSTRTQGNSGSNYNNSEELKVDHEGETNEKIGIGLQKQSLSMQSTYQKGATNQQVQMKIKLDKGKDFDSEKKMSNKSKLAALSGDGSGNKVVTRSASNKSGNGSHGSSETFDELIHQIQHDMKLAKDDPEKQFKVLDGHIYKLAVKKIGSKFLQDLLKKASPKLINKIIEQIDGQLADLMLDNYGNYFCSELIRYLKEHQRIHFLKQIKGKKFIDISCNNRGTWALQTIILAVTEEEEFKIIKDSLLQNDNICTLAMNNQGEHMLQKIITTFSEDRRAYIFDEIMKNFKLLATDKQGLCVMKRLIEHTKQAQNQTRIVDKIKEDCLGYVKNEFGNFVVNEVMQQFSFEMTRDIIKSIQGHYVELSQNKYSSKFIEICIDRAPKGLQNSLIEEFLLSQDLHKVVESSFGNFVLQNSLNKYIKDKNTSDALVETIIECLPYVGEYKIQQKWGQDILVKFLKNHPDQSLMQHLHEIMGKIQKTQKPQHRDDNEGQQVNQSGLHQNDIDLQRGKNSKKGKKQVRNEKLVLKETDISYAKF